MGINKKGKRRLTYHDTVFYWYIATDSEADGEYDSGCDFLHIMTEDKRIVLLYHINEVNSYWSQQVVRVLKSDELPCGGYRLFPLLADEVITAASVKKILGWYYDRVENSCMAKGGILYDPTGGT